MRKSLLVSIVIMALALAASPQAVRYYQPPSTTGNVTTNASVITAPVSELGSATVSIHGTHAGIVGIFELSDDSTTGSDGTWYTTTCSRTDVTLWESAPTVATNASRAWDCSVFGSRYLRFRSTGYGSGTGVVNITPTAVPIEPAMTVGIDPSSDPCASPSAVKQSASVAFSSATTAALIAAVTGKKIYVCSIYFTMSSGTTPTIAFKGGTGGSCGAATVTFTGVMALPTASGSVIQFGGPYATFITASGSEFCATTAGTTPTGNGFIVYVQQ